MLGHRQQSTNTTDTWLIKQIEDHCSTGTAPDHLVVTMRLQNLSWKSKSVDRIIRIRWWERSRWNPQRAVPETACFLYPCLLPPLVPFMSPWRPLYCLTQYLGNQGGNTWPTPSRVTRQCFLLKNQKGISSIWLQLPCNIQVLEAAAVIIIAQQPHLTTQVWTERWSTKWQPKCPLPLGNRREREKQNQKKRAEHESREFHKWYSA